MRAKTGPDPTDGLELFAFDPGGTTGWAYFACPTENVFKMETDLLDGMEVQYGQLSGKEPVQGMQAYDLLKEDGFVGPVIIEDFTLRRFDQGDDLLSPVRMTARIEQMMEMLNWQRGVGEYSRTLMPDGKVAALPNAWRELRSRRQSAEMAMSTATDARLKDWGLWATGKPHARDAMRHGITFLRRAKTDGSLRRWGWPELFELIEGS